MDLKVLLQKTRSYRRFDESQRISEAALLSLVELTRYCSSARNQQALKFYLIYKEKDCHAVYMHTQWAGYLKDWNGPEKGERPAAYILVLKDSALTKKLHCDDGLAIQTIMLGATEMGLGGCILGAFNKKELMTIFKIDAQFEPLYLLALGKPAEKIVLDEMENGDTKYWRDVDQVHHVPKRLINDLIIPKK